MYILVSFLTIRVNLLYNHVKISDAVQYTITNDDKKGYCMPMRAALNRDTFAGGAVGAVGSNSCC